MKPKFTAPPFAAPKNKPANRFVWWSWHPMYPYWSRSCWGAPTQAEAEKLLAEPNVSLDVYHNKLIHHKDDGTMVEVKDVPCQRMDLWNRFTQKEHDAALGIRAAIDRAKNV